MKLRHFHILLILLVALALCPLLGGYCGTEGLTNIDEHLRNDHGVNSGGGNSGGGNAGGVNNESSNSHDHSTITERLDNLEKTMREPTSNTPQGTNPQGSNAQAPSGGSQSNYNTQGAGSTALDNVGGNMRSMGALENNKIPEHKHSEEDKVPPCPPCARCPESSFSCKKVPNYASVNNEHLPRPVLNNFSSFGM
jgi:hypothetical protein